MSLYIDEKYARLVSPRLEGFHPVGKHKYVFRCPFCGDSTKSKLKMRGTFYPKNNDLNFGCYNCGRSTTFQKVIETLDPGLAKEYMLERYTSREMGARKPVVPQEPPKQRVTAFEKNDGFLSLMSSIAELPEGHFARQYIANRLIPEEFWSSLYYTDNFRSIVDAALPDHEYKLRDNDARVVLPFRDPQRRVIAFQGRALLSSSLRYITVKVVQSVPKVFGLDRLDPKAQMYLVEGPFDSMFLPNALAAAGSDLPQLDAFRDRLTIVYDNEPRNLQIVSKMEMVIKLGYKLCIWPETVKQKDINDMVLSGMRPDIVKSLIDRSTLQGMQAMLMLNRWRRC